MQCLLRLTVGHPLPISLLHLRPLLQLFRDNSLKEPVRSLRSLIRRLVRLPGIVDTAKISQALNIDACFLPSLACSCSFLGRFIGFPASFW